MMLRSKILQFVILPFLLTGIAVSGSMGQEKTKVDDVKASRMLLGRHMLSLQWISWDHFGTATVTNRNGVYYLKGRQNGRGNTNFVTVDGVVTRIDSKQFSLNGKVVMQIDHINGGKPCIREGELTFKVTGTRKYWRMQEMDNPCDTATDYVDIYFR